eukprot:1183313-Prorocentrum_minimum.AAC.2
MSSLGASALCRRITKLMQSAIMQCRWSPDTRPGRSHVASIEKVAPLCVAFKPRQLTLSHSSLWMIQSLDSIYIGHKPLPAVAVPSCLRLPGSSARYPACAVPLPQRR